MPVSLSLANEAQYLLLNLESGKYLVNKIRSRYESEEQNAHYNFNEEKINVDKLMARFRGNLIVDGVPSFDEDKWQEVVIGDNSLQVRLHMN